MRPKKAKASNKKGGDQNDLGPATGKSLVYNSLIATTTATAAAAEVATTTAAATATAARRTLFARLGNVDSDCTAVDLAAVEGLNGLLSFLGGAHGDETESAGTTAHAVHHQVGFHDSAVCRKGVLQVVFSGVEGKISNKQFSTHLIIAVQTTSASRDCSRPSGFKSSLNHVHLRIQHALEATSYLTDAHHNALNKKVSKHILKIFSATIVEILHNH